MEFVSCEKAATPKRLLRWQLDCCKCSSEFRAGLINLHLHICAVLRFKADIFCLPASVVGRCFASMKA